MLTDRRPILLANARVVDPSREFDGPGDVLIADGVIRDSRRGIGAAGVPEGTDIINCSGKVVAPGLIDMRAFVGEPGASHRETFASASQAAAAGGITTIICQPDTSPVIDNSATVDFILRRARDTAIVNIHPMAALTKGMRGEEMTEIGLLKAAGADVSASVSINHVTLNENDIGPYRTFMKLSPPLRTEQDRQALVAALSSGLVDVIMSDHNPQDVEVKRLPFAEAASGAVGLQTMLPAGLRLIHSGDIDFKTLIRAMSTRPAELLGLPGGSLRAGSPADLVVIDADTPWVLDPADLKSQCKNTPFDEARFSGRVVRTIVGGRTVYEHVV